MSFENNRLESRDVRLDGRLGGRKRCGRWFLPIFLSRRSESFGKSGKDRKMDVLDSTNTFYKLQLQVMFTVLRALCKLLLRYKLIMPSHGDKQAGVKLQ